VPHVEADLLIMLGTSLKASPTNDLPLTLASRGKPLVLVNLQRTPLDPIGSLCIFIKTEEVSVVKLFRAVLGCLSFEKQCNLYQGIQNIVR
jgi:NAD-dependent SIR2 family protein deacetylase